MISLSSIRPLRTSPIVRNALSFAQQQSRTRSTTATPTTENTIPANTPKDLSSPDELRVVQSVNRQAPNRKGVWSPNQRPRPAAMVGPRFEQTDMSEQPQPYAAIELIHKQPVRWVNKRIVSCDGGGGPLGHPRIFINVDKPEINACTYCGLPFAHEHHRKHIESLSNNSYPLGSTGDAAEVQENQRVTDEPLGQR